MLGKASGRRPTRIRTFRRGARRPVKQPLLALHPRTPTGIANPTLTDYNIETASRVRAHAAGIDDATGPAPFIDAEAIAVDVEDRYLDQVRTDQGLWADEDTIAYRHRINAEFLKTQMEIADAELPGREGRTPWRTRRGLRHHWHAPHPRPGMAVPGLPAPRPMSAEDAATLGRVLDVPRSGLPKRVG